MPLSTLFCPILFWIMLSSPYINVFVTCSICNLCIGVAYDISWLAFYYIYIWSLCAYNKDQHHDIERDTLHQLPWPVRGQHVDQRLLLMNSLQWRFGTVWFSLKQYTSSVLVPLDGHKSRNYFHNTLSSHTWNIYSPRRYVHDLKCVKPE